MVFSQPSVSFQRSHPCRSGLLGSIPMHHDGSRLLGELGTPGTRGGCPGELLFGGELLCPQQGACRDCRGEPGFFGCLPAGLAVGLTAVFVLICSLCLLAAELKLLQWENQGLLNPGLFPVSAHTAATTVWAGDTQGQDHGGGTSMVTVAGPWQHLGDPYSWCFCLLYQFPCPSQAL